MGNLTIKPVCECLRYPQSMSDVIDYVTALSFREREKSKSRERERERGGGDSGKKNMNRISNIKKERKKERKEE